MAIFVRWFPPSLAQISVQKKIIVIDPAYLKKYFRRYPKKIEFTAWPDPIDGLPEGLGKADLILVKHHHKDHCKRVTVDRLRRSETLVVAPKRCTKELGDGIKAIKAGDRLTFDNLVIKAVHAYNTREGRSTRKQHKKGDGVGYQIGIAGKTIYYAEDTDFIPEMPELGNVDVSFLPVGGKFTMDIGEAAAAANAIRPKLVIPMHRFKANLFKFADQIETDSDINTVLLDIGDSYGLAD